ncbi:MAG: DUF2164 domain-containing protein [Oceanobacter sp.]
MSDIEFSRQEKDIMVEKIKLYFREELDQEIGGFQAEFLIDFFAKEFAGVFYNRALYDAQTLLASKFEEMSDALFQLEKPLD